MTQIIYSDLDALKQRMTDLELLKDEMTRQLENVLESTPKISQRGKNRLLLAIANYPKQPVKPIVDATELAALHLSIKIKETQLIMLMIATELGNIEKQQQSGESSDQAQ